MSSGVLPEAVRAPGQHNGQHVVPLSPVQTTSGWRCGKRDGSVVPFDVSKVEAALRKCFASVPLPEGGDVAALAARLGRGVVNALAGRRLTCPGVEDVQQLVIQQLYVEGLFEQAEHYQNYRERRRQARASKPIPPEYAAAVAEDAQHFPTQLSYYQFISKFARWSDEKKRRETWRESCDRVLGWFKGLPKVAGKLTGAEWAELDASLYDMETCCAMRVVQMAGPALERCNVGAFNCWYTPLDSLRAFAEFLYVLMAGGGCGFSVEDRYVSQLPRIRHQKTPAVRHDYVVEDSTEGWCDALLFGLERWFDGEDVWFDVSKIRPRGTRLKTKGGRASGPGPLVELFAFARKLVTSRQGQVLTDLDCHDLACVIGKIVQVGGVRRAATVSLSDLGSQRMRDCKSGNWYTHAVWRTMANNSAVFERRPDVDTFLAEFSALIRSRSGERGIFNRAAVRAQLPERRHDVVYWGGNPCQEVRLRPRQACNLSIVPARPWDTRESLKRKVRIATYWGCMQKTATRFGYLGDEWRRNCEEEALLGVDISGHADCPLLRFGAPGRAELLREFRQVVAEVDVELSARFGVNRSAADTCVKPAGDSAAFFSCASGVSPWFDVHIMRWVREPAGSPVAQLLLSEGVPNAVAPEDPSLLVFGFPRRAPDGATTRHDLTALDQLNNWLEWQENWAEHGVSATIYVDEHEWPDVMAWVYRNFDEIGALSFLPRDNGVYTYAPNESLTREQYEAALAKFPQIKWEKLSRFEDDDMTVAAQTPACTAGGCAYG